MEACFAYCKAFLLLFVQESMRAVSEGSTLSVRIKWGKSYGKISRISKQTNIVLVLVLLSFFFFFLFLMCTTTSS